MAPKGEGIWTRRPLPCATWWIKSRVRWASRKQALQQLMKEAFLLEMERKRQMGGRLREDGPAPPSIGKTEPATCAGAGPG